MDAKTRREIALEVLKGCRCRKPYTARIEFKPGRSVTAVKPKGHDRKHVSGRTWSMCERKCRYDSQAMAERVCRRAEQERGVRLRAYECGRCGGWHITKRFREERDVAV